MTTPEDLAKGNHPNCCLCGGKTNPHAGNPNLWPIKLCTPDSNGATRPHCTGCVISRVYATPKPAAEVVEALQEMVDAYEKLMASGYQRIVEELHGECDSLEEMIYCDPHLSKARAALAAQSERGKQDQPSGIP